jgi:RND family efflux transporter MFP subunit
MKPPQAPVNALADPSDLSGLAIDRSVKTRSSGLGRTITVGTLAVLSLILIAYSIWLWRQHAPIVVQTAIVSSSFPSQSLTHLNATGYVIAQRKASVASKATGRLEWLGVLEGSKVRAGEVIARLENRDTQALRDQAAANVQVAQANLGQGRAELSEAELGFKRSEDLVSKKFISESAHDSAQARLNKARAALAGYEAAVSVARANLRVSEVALDQAVIRAPFDGVVINRNANVGDTITPFSQAVDTKGAVVTIADMTSLEVEADVAESSLSSIHVGQAVDIQLDAIPDHRMEGVVNRIVPTMDRAKGTILVKIRFLRPDPRVLPDMSAKVAFLKRKVSAGERKQIFSVPSSAVIQLNGRQNVYVFEDGKAHLRPVEVGSKVGDKIEIHGVAPGTRVLVQPPAGVVDGRAVKLEAK